MTKYRLKVANKNDFAHISFIQKNDGLEHSYYLTEDRIERLADSGEKFFVFYEDEHFVGMASIDLEIRAQLHFFSILKENQKKGLDKKMLDLLLEEVGKHEVEHQTIHCFSEPDSPLVNFLKKEGFEEVGFYKNRYQNGKDAVIVEKVI